MHALGACQVLEKAKDLVHRTLLKRVALIEGSHQVALVTSHEPPSLCLCECLRPHLLSCPRGRRWQVKLVKVEAALNLGGEKLSPDEVTFSRVHRPAARS